MERKSSLSMEAVKFYGYPDQTISPYRSHINGSKRITNPFISTPHPNNFMLHKMGILQTPPSFLTHSYPPYSFQQPPLLPLPAANPRQAANCPGITRSLPVNNKINNTNRPKKSKSNTNKLQKDVKKALPCVSTGTTNDGVSTNSLSALKVEEGDVGMFLGSSGGFTISPPPSSLPLPTFSLRPKLSCSNESVPAIDSRATDNLRRILQLR